MRTRVLYFQFSSYRVRWYACIIAFYTFARKSTLLPISIAKFDPEKSICRSDIVFTDYGALLTVRHTKTIQFGERIREIPIPKITPHSKLCPVWAIECMFKLSPTRQPSDHLFSYVTTGSSQSVKLTPLTHSSFVKTLKLVLSQCGYEPLMYSGHSFRRGGATFAFSLGIPSLLIKQQGDWKSNVFERYISFNDTTKYNVAKAMALAML